MILSRYRVRTLFAVVALVAIGLAAYPRVIETWDRFQKDGYAH